MIKANLKGGYERPSVNVFSIYPTQVLMASNFIAIGEQSSSCEAFGEDGALIEFEW